MGHIQGLYLTISCDVGEGRRIDKKKGNAVSEFRDLIFEIRSHVSQLQSHPRQMRLLSTFMQLRSSLQGIKLKNYTVIK